MLRPTIYIPSSLLRLLQGPPGPPAPTAPAKPEGSGPTEPPAESGGSRRLAAARVGSGP